MLDTWRNYWDKATKEAAETATACPTQKSAWQALWREQDKCDVVGGCKLAALLSPKSACCRLHPTAGDITVIISMAQSSGGIIHYYPLREITTFAVGFHD